MKAPLSQNIPRLVSQTEFGYALVLILVALAMSGLAAAVCWRSTDRADAALVARSVVSILDGALLRAQRERRTVTLQCAAGTGSLLWSASKTEPQRSAFTAPGSSTTLHCRFGTVGAATNVASQTIAFSPSGHASAGEIIVIGPSSSCAITQSVLGAHRTECRTEDSR